MEDRAKELSKLLKTGRIGLVDHVTGENLTKEIADLLAPPEYPCNGELVEFIDEDGGIGFGRCTTHGVTIYGGDLILWSHITDYRIIREANEYVPNPDTWPKDCNRIIVFSKPIYSGTVCDTDSEISARNYTRAEAEEMHRELK